MHEYAFDIKMFAVVKIKAANQKQAEVALKRALDCASLQTPIPDPAETELVTEASIYLDDEEFPYLFEVDGEDVEDCQAR